MKKVLETYLEKFAVIKPKLEKFGFTLTEHKWLADGFYNAHWNEGDQPITPLEKYSKTLAYEPEFYSKNVEDKRFHLKGSLRDQESLFWSFDLIYYPLCKLHDREGFLGPTAGFEISSILEEDFDNIPKFIEKLKKTAEALKS